MAKQPRVQVDSGLTPERLQPRASPVDTFSNPRAGDNKLAKLAQGLSELSPSLQRFAGQVTERVAKDKQLEGEAKAQELIESQISYKEAVDKGLLRPDQNPWFRLGMKKQFAGVAAQNYATLLREKSTELIEGGETDPQAFRALEADLRKEFVNSAIGEEYRDAGFDAFFADQVNQLASGIAQNFAVAAGKQAMKQAHEAFGTRAYGLLENTPEDQWKQVLQEEADDAVQTMGLDGSKVNRLMAQAVIDFAIDNKRYDLLGVEPDPSSPDGWKTTTGEGLLSQLSGGSGPVGNITAIRKARRDAATALRQTQQAEWAHDRAQTQRNRDIAYNGFTQALAEHEGDIMSFDVEPWAAEVAKYDPNLANEIREMPAAQAATEVQSDPRVLDGLRFRISQGDAGNAQIVGAYNSNKITGRDAQVLMQTLTTYNQYKASVENQFDPIESSLWRNRLESSVDAMAGNLGFMESMMPGGRSRNERIDDELLSEQAKGWARDLFMAYWNAGGEGESREQWRDKIDEIREATQEEFFGFTEEEYNEAARESQTKRDALWSGQKVLSDPQIDAIRSYLTGEVDRLDPSVQRTMIELQIPEEKLLEVFEAQRGISNN